MRRANAFSQSHLSVCLSVYKALNFESIYLESSLVVRSYVYGICDVRVSGSLGHWVNVKVTGGKVSIYPIRGWSIFD